MTFQRISWNSIKFHESSLNFIIFYEIPWNVIIFVSGRFRAVRAAVEKYALVWTREGAECCLEEERIFNSWFDAKRKRKNNNLPLCSILRSVFVLWPTVNCLKGNLCLLHFSTSLWGGTGWLIESFEGGRGKHPCLQSTGLPCLWFQLTRNPD